MAIDIGRKFFSNFFLSKNCRFIATTKIRMTAKLIDGKNIANEIQQELKVETDKWVAAGNRRPSLVAILVGEDPASSTYVANKMKAAQNVGINSKTEKFPKDMLESDLLKKIDELNNDDEIDGILVQLPLPEHMNERLICSAVTHEKDVDGFHVMNVGQMVLGQQTLFPCTPAGVMELIKRSGVATFGKNAVVCGRSKNVGMPIAMMLHSDGRDDTLLTVKAPNIDTAISTAARVVGRIRPVGLSVATHKTEIAVFGPPRRVPNTLIALNLDNTPIPVKGIIKYLGLTMDNRYTEYSMDCTTTICHRYTPREELTRFAQTADIIVTATGVPGLITKEMVKPGACIIDVGITRVKDPDTGKTKLVGDVDFDNVKEVAGHITPVPGGVGPMTVTMLMKNAILAAKYRAQKNHGA